MNDEEQEPNILYSILIHLVIALMVSIPVLAYGYSVATDMKVMKTKAARDLSLTVEAAGGSPGTVFFSYADSFGFQYKIGKSRVDVYLETEDTLLPSLTYYLFPEDSALNFIYPHVLNKGLSKSTIVSMKKSHPDFIFNQDDLSFSSTNCEKIDVSSDPKSVMVLDRSTIPTTQGIIRDEVLIPNLKSAGISSEYYDDVSQFLGVVSSNQGAVILEIDTPIMQQGVKIFTVEDKKSRRLACLIKNELTKKDIKTSVLLSSSSDNKNLANPVSLRIEISSISPRSEITKLVADGVKEYFK